MKFVVFDAETFYSDDFTLSKMSTEAYIRDKRFEAHGAAIKWQADIPARWYDERQLRYVLKEHDWSDTFLIAWHQQFDGLILTHHYDVHPKMWGCPMSMARMIHGSSQSVSLDNIRKLYNMPLKTTPYNLFKGKHWNEMTPDVQDQVARGCEDEVESVWQLFLRFAKGFPVEEFDVIDSVIRMFVDPVLTADMDMLAKLWKDESEAKIRRMAALNLADDSQLQSAAKFIELLEAEGVEIEYKPGKKGPIPAFAKSDEFMQDLLEHPNERIRTLAEARIGAKSTLLQTRAETLGWMGKRGPLCVYLRHAGAGTLRPSGGDGANWLNFKRGSTIRRSIMAPDGFLLAPVDSSQIEFRVGAYLAGQNDMVELLRSGGDPYIGIASEFYGERIYRPEKDDPRRLEMEQKRGAGKQAQLMCLGPSTEVLTNNGIKPIVAVSLQDCLWDGVEWVGHSGLIYQGEQNVEDYSGVKMTSDHLVLCDRQHWLPAACLQNESILSRALDVGSANLPWLALKWEQKADLSKLWFAAHAIVQNIQLIHIICIKALQRNASLALEKLQVTGARNILAMQMCARTTPIEFAYWVEFQRFTDAALKKQNIQITQTTAGVESEFIKNGSKTSALFWLTWLRFRVGIIRSYQLIVSKIIKGIFQEICDSQHLSNRLPIDAVCEISNKLSKVYDLSCAGPRNRFTILSSRGPIIVHNCQYGAAGKQFQKTARAGLYGPPIDLSIEDANRFVKLYRDTTPAMCAKNIGYWAQAERMIARLAGGPPIEWGPLTVKNHKIYLPNGCFMVYDSLEYHRPDSDEDVKDFERDGYWRLKTKNGWKKLWGSKLVQNICEAVSRVIVTQAMLRIKHMGFRTLNHPYDELLLLIPDDSKAEENLQACMAQMRVTPSWLPGIPLDCEGSLGKRYSK